MEQNKICYLNRFTRALQEDFGDAVPVASLLSAIRNHDVLLEYNGHTRISSDASWIKEAESVLVVIRSIIRSPHIHLRREETTKNIASSYKLDARVIRDTCRDSRVWRQSPDGKLYPEKSHTYTYEDEDAIYENRFIALVMDRMLTTLSRKIDEIFAEALTLRKRAVQPPYGVRDLSFFADFDPMYSTMQPARPAGESDASYLAAMSQRVPLLTTSEEPKFLTRMLLIRRRLLQLMHTSFYRNCKKAGALRIAAVKPTNILVHDRRYNRAFRFFLDYLLKQDKKPDEEPVCPAVYANYFLTKILYEMYRSGFEAEDRAQLMGKDGAYLADGIVLVKDPIYATITSDGIKGLRLDVSLTSIPPEKNALGMMLPSPEASYYLAFCDRAPKEMEDSPKAIDEYFDRLIAEKRMEDYTDAYVITSLEEQKHPHAALADQQTHRLDYNVQNVLKSIFFFAAGSHVLYSRICPVCGSFHLDHEGKNYRCLDCDSLYALPRFSRNRHSVELVWLKQVTDKPIDPQILKRIESDKEEEAERQRLQEELAAALLTKTSEAEGTADEEVEATEASVQAELAADDAWVMDRESADDASAKMSADDV